MQGSTWGLYRSTAEPGKVAREGLSARPLHQPLCQQGWLSLRAAVCLWWRRVHRQGAGPTTRSTLTLTGKASHKPTTLCAGVTSTPPGNP